MAGRNNNTDIFRKKSIERVSSPDNLDRYIRSTKPSLWLLLAAIIVFLAGIIIWGIFGKIDSSGVVGIRVENNIATIYIKEAEYTKVSDKSYLELNGVRYTVKETVGPLLYSDNSDLFLLRASEIEEGTWYYTLISQVDIKDGEYKGRIVYDRISPITFIIN